MLVDSRLYHVWKPSLHEVAAGTLDIHQEGLSYQMLAHDRGFTFVYGAMTALDAGAKSLTVAAVNAPDGEEVLAARQINYGSLVIAVGSTSNYFGVPGARENTISLNATEDAERFRLRLLRLMAQAAEHQQSEARSGLDIVIIGGGATGVELAAELREASSAYAAYGFNRLQVQRDVRITLIEGASRILAPLPERVSAAATRLLEQRAIAVVTDCRVTAIDKHQVSDSNGKTYPADMCVWAAGIRAPEFLGALGLPVNKGGQIEVDAHLRVAGVADVYAIGDCAACLDGNGKPVPPRAQAAHQQSEFLLKNFMNAITGHTPLKQPYVYRDYGSLVSIGHSTTVGSLMGSLRGASLFVEGFMARMMYLSLHMLHHQAVLGTLRTGLMAMGRFLIRRTTPIVKLH